MSNRIGGQEDVRRIPVLLVIIGLQVPFALFVPALGETIGLSLPSSFAYHEGRGGSSVMRDAIHLQEVYTSDQFPSHPIAIREIRWRPSSEYGRSFTGRLERLQISLSTTAKQPRSLSRTFGRNVGMDDTTVFDGPIELRSEFSGPKRGPKAFDIIVPLTNSFLYDSRVGNLLLDIRNHVAGDVSFVDAGPSSRVGRVFSLGADAVMGTVGDYGGDCIQVVYTEAASGEQVSSAGLMNGSFEGGIEPGPRVSLFAGDRSSLWGWRVDHGVVDYVAGRWKASDGARCVALRARGGSSISQLVRGLEPARWYELSFALGGTPEMSPGSTFVAVSVAGVSNQFAVVNGTAGREQCWVTNVLVFCATGETECIRFSCSGVGAAGPIVDGITMRTRPEPEDWRPVTKWHDLAADYSAESNPVGVWSLGCKLALESPLVLLTYAGETNRDNERVVTWQSADYGGVGIDRIYRWSAKGPPGTDWVVRAVLSYDEVEERFGVARFTVPVGASGLYRVETRFREAWSGRPGRDAEFRVFRAGRELFGRLLASGASGSYITALELKGGETIDFVVGHDWTQSESRAVVEFNARIGLMEVDSGRSGGRPISGGYEIERSVVSKIR